MGVFWKNDFFLDKNINNPYTVGECGKQWEVKLPGFSGKNYYTIDSKGRIPVPPSIKEILSTNYSTKLIFVNHEFDHCLCAYPVDEWNKLLEKVKGMPQTSDAVKYYMRRVVGSAIECEIDKQGRVLIPSALRGDARLSSDVVLLGLGNRIEIWDRKEHENVADPSKLDKETIRNYKHELSSSGL